jgi:hypothetical protein
MRNTAIRFTATLSATFLFLSAGAICASASSLGGTITHAENGAPIGGVQVEAFADIDTRPLTTTITDTHGRFSFSDLPGAEYRLLLHSPPLFDTVVAGIALGPAEDRQLPSPLSMEAAFIFFVPPNVIVDPPHQARLRGQVVGTTIDADGKRSTTAPVSGVAVGAFAVGYDILLSTAYTDAAGHFAFNFLPAGEYVVRALGEEDKSGEHLMLPPGSSVLLAYPIVVESRVYSISDPGGPPPRDPCSLLQPRETADVYVVCGE